MTATTPEALRRPEPNDEHAEQPVSTLELFFDLVFVFTLTQLTALLAYDLTTETAARVVIMFVVLFWMYGGYAWLTNAVPPDRPVRQLLLLLGMMGFLVCALAIPHAFDSAGVPFGLGYLLVVVVHAGLYQQAYGSPRIVRLAPLNVLAAVCVIVAGLLDASPLVYGLWLLAIAIEFVTPLIARSGTPFQIHPDHFVERHGLLLIVALGESVIAIGTGLGEDELGPEAYVGAILGLALAAALWWAYFADDHDGAGRAMRGAPIGPRFALAIQGYFYAYIPMLLGIVALAAGVKLSLGHLAETLDPAPALALGGGIASFLAGNVLFRRVMGITPVRGRAVTAVLAASTAIVGVGVGAGAQIGVLVLLLAGLLALEWSGRGGEDLAGERLSASTAR